jgi:hypothetical protein
MAGSSRIDEKEGLFSNSVLILNVLDAREFFVKGHG